MTDARPADGRLPSLMRTLAANGFLVNHALRRHWGIQLDTERHDIFGVPIKYRILVADNALTEQESVAAAGDAEREGAIVVGITSEPSRHYLSMSGDHFEAKFGGTVASFLPLDPDFAANLIQLGFNSPVAGLIGNPDDLYEEHVHAALQFVVNGRVVRYGQKFRGAVLPDGVAIVSGQSLFLYDAKAYREGYPVSRDSIRQFADYVRRFHGSYESTLGRLSGFLLVSSSFDVPPGHHQTRSTELFAECAVPLVFVTSGVLGAICAECARRPELRRHVRWREVIVPPDLDLERFRSAVQMLDREGLT